MTAILFWSATESEDEINSEIWTRSPIVQNDIQPSTHASDPPSVGAEQIMLRPGVALPWVPDLLGRNWRSQRSILVVGSAYAPFVRGTAKRSRCMDLDDYVKADSWRAFQQKFIEDVVVGDPNYYSRVAALARATSTPMDCSGLAVWDLCRVSFVLRDKQTGHSSADDGLVTGENRNLFLSYVEHRVNQDWLWRRITDTDANRIVALGKVAAKGLLRMFESRDCTIDVCGLSDFNQRMRTAAHWPQRLIRERNICQWTESQAWWEISTSVGPRQRC